MICVTKDESVKIFQSSRAKVVQERENSHEFARKKIVGRHLRWNQINRQRSEYIET